MKTYDPNCVPDSSEWLAMDEGERVHLIERFHRKAGLSVGNAKLHAHFHAIVENQLAIPDVAVRETLQRLLSEGLDRHDAIHAIGSVLAGIVFDATREPSGGSANFDAAYHNRLKALTADSWRSGD